MSINRRWIKKVYYIYIHNGLSLNHKKTQITPFAATWMQLDIIILSEVRKSKENDIKYLCNLKYNNELIFETDSQT